MPAKTKKAKTQNGDCVADKTLTPNRKPLQITTIGDAIPNLPIDQPHRRCIINNGNTNTISSQTIQISLINFTRNTSKVIPPLSHPHRAY